MTAAQIDADLREKMRFDPTAAIVADPVYAWTWHCKIVTVLMGQGKIMSQANNEAREWMKTTYGVDTKGPPQHLPPL